MHTDIVTAHRDNQVFVSSREVAAKFGKLHSNVVRDIKNLIFQNKDNENISKFISLNFEEQRILLNNSPRRGRPPEPHYLMTRDGFVLLSMGFNGKKALEWKLKFLQAFNDLEQTVLAEIPKLQQRITELEADTSRKAFPGARTGMISAPVLASNLWGEEEIVAWELQPKDTLDEYLLTLANLRHCNLVAKGLEEKKRILTDVLVNEELNRRSTVTDLTERRFKLIKSKKKPPN